MNDSGQERQEPATPKRRKDARQKGQVFRSSEVTSVFALLGGIAALALGARSSVVLLRAYLAESLVNGLPAGDLTVEGLGVLFSPALGVMVRCCLPTVAGAMVMGLAANFAQVGLLFTGGPIAPKFDRINPVAGAKRVFSRRALIELVKSLAKVGIVAVVVYVTVAPQIKSFGGFALLDLEQALDLTGRLAWTVILRAVVALFLVAALDFAYQRSEYEQGLRMTKEEVKQELKETEGDPQIRGRIRQKQREMARRRMMAEVPKADVVVVNPVHYACALVYRQGETAAPALVAKGRGYVAVRIKDIARQHRVPIVENPPLARTIHETVEIGGQIPPELYQAVAEVLAFVYRSKGRVA